MPCCLYCDLPFSNKSLSTHMKICFKQCITSMEIKNNMEVEGAAEAAFSMESAGNEFNVTDNLISDELDDDDELTPEEDMLEEDDTDDASSNFSVECDNEAIESSDEGDNLSDESVDHTEIPGVITDASSVPGQPMVFSVADPKPLDKQTKKSIELYTLVQEGNISRDAHKKLIKFFNELIMDLNIGKEISISFGEWIKPMY